MVNGSAGVTPYVHRALELFATYGDREALVGGGRRLTFADARAEVFDLAAALRRHGVRPGAGVLITAGNPVEGPLLQLALHLLGCRTIWIAPAPRREVDDYVRRSDAEVLIYDVRTQAEFGADLAATLSGVSVLCLGAGGAGPDLLDRTGTDGPAPLDLAAVAALAPPLPESVLQTSGTTGVPKLVHYRHDFFEQVLTLAGKFVADGFPLLRHLSTSALWAVGGQMTTFFNLFTGGVLFLVDEWEPGEFLATIERERINSSYVSPPRLYELLDHPATAGTDTSSLFMFNVGGAPAAPARLRQAIGLFGPVLRIVYGLSECAVVAAQPGLREDPDHPERLGSCGLPYGDVRVRIRDEHGAELPAGETGEVWVSSALNFGGYYDQPELTERSLVDGWVRTHDIGRLDADGYLYLLDRAQDMTILGSGWNIYSRPIEDILAAHPEVRAAAVIGVPDMVAGEAVHAYVVAAPDAKVDGDELRAMVRDELNELWAPRTVEFVEALPLTRTSKVDKKVLRSRYAAEHA